jgi:hypothetical protein
VVFHVPSDAPHDGGLFREPGDEAALAVFDGDPFEYMAHAAGVRIDGAPGA